MNTCQMKNILKLISLLFIIFNSIVTTLNAQDKIIDSLKLELKKSTNDTTKCKILDQLVEITSDEEWPKYNEELLKIAELNLKKQSLSKKENLLFQKHYALGLNNLGISNYSNGNKDAALKFYSKSLTIFEKINDEDYQALLLNNIGAIYDDQGKNDIAISYFLRSLNIYEKSKNKNGIATSLNNIGYLQKKIGKIDLAISNYNKCLKIYEEINDNDGIAIVLNNLSAIYNMKGEPKNALIYLNKSLVLREKNNDQEGIATVLNNIGETYNNIGQIAKSIDYYSKSLKIYEKIENKDGVATCFNNIGYIYLNQKEYSKAEIYFKKSLEINTSIQNQSGIALCYNNLGVLLQLTNDFNKTLEYFNKSLLIYKTIDDKEGQAMVLFNIGDLYENDNNRTKAMYFFNESLKIQESINNKKGIAYALNRIGEIYYELKNNSKSITIANRSLIISQEIGFPENIKRSALLLKKIYKSAGNYKLSLENYELFIQMRDSLNNIETQKATIRQQTQYEFDKQQAVQKEKHDAEIKLQVEKSLADKKKQNIILLSVSFVLLIVALFSFLLFKRFKTTQHQKIIIEKKEKETQEQKHLVEEKQKEILDSIHYAKRLQEAILPPLHFINEHVPNNFVLYQPKDVVAGDFYWAEIKDDKFFIAVADSTGHGVPGAMVSVVCSNALNRTLNEFGITDTGKILDKTRELVLETFAKGNSEVKDGMDISLLCIDKQNNKAFWSGANNPLWYVKSSVTSSAVEKSTDTGLDSARPDIQLIEIKADKQPIGKSEITKPFTVHEIALKDGMQFYLFTDGFADQFGGPKGKKFMYKQLENLLLSISHESMEFQKQKLEDVFEDWKGDLEQVDDVCVIGMKI
jgi:tetratricopeptide (TPR) repeat protein